MKRYGLLLSFLLLTGAANAQEKLKLVRTITLPAVKGSFDLMAYDIGGHRLFLSAQDDHSVEVIDLQKGKLIKSLSGFNEPKWCFFDHETGLLYVATGKDGKVSAVDSHNFQTVKTYTFREKCNNLRYDAQTHQLFVGVGDTFGAIGIIDLRQQTIIGQIPLAGFPKQFELTAQCIYVNVPGKGMVQVIDRKTSKIIAKWKVSPLNDNVPMVLDREHQLLYIGCAGGRLVVYDVSSEKQAGSISIHKDVDGIYLDPKRQQLYVSCGEGFIDIIGVDKQRLASIGQLTTRVGAGTSLFIPQINRYVLAEPQTSDQPAAIRIYQPM
ncbi:WD40 repeat domain-containing protein [Mucilaginibacter sp. SMC90]|uniref:YncE family protein n=1 Tax=unclassified Mucilaginibacter TaxID=2617802 RepID=UPI001BCB0B04|nr:MULTISPECIES: WD40 repeat domain-containing protein [unclassified Mucilaginibacter]MBS7565710.1 WD40 repeat domain-containing protein [Mucilaginibacter sp. Bleaf8]UOE49828.1 WD40 repeat domain-containing protein [Mucilaginibacter sp. SMC90]